MEAESGIWAAVGIFAMAGVAGIAERNEDGVNFSGFPNRSLHTPGAT